MRAWPEDCSGPSGHADQCSELPSGSALADLFVMPSVALTTWESSRSNSLDEIEHAHLMVGGSGPGRRYATQQINQAYAVLLSSHFQGFCRGLHSESADHLAGAVSPAILQSVIYPEFVFARKLDFGNPNPGNIGSDFGRLGISLWTELQAADSRTQQRRRSLKELNRWRNAIAHQEFDPGILGKQINLRIEQVRVWRTVCSGLAISLDEVMRAHVAKLIGRQPW